MQVVLTANGFKIHCRRNLIVKLLHKEYTQNQIDYIRPYLIRAIKSLSEENRLNLKGFSIIGMTRGWYFFESNNPEADLWKVMSALIMLRSS